jgi:hypothetical protein
MFNQQKTSYYSNGNLCAKLLVYPSNFNACRKVKQNIFSKVNTKLDTFIACLYYQVATQVTVGYGDIVVATDLGRFIMVVSIIIGITSTSIILIFFMRLMQQDSKE